MLHFLITSNEKYSKSHVLKKDVTAKKIMFLNYYLTTTAEKINAVINKFDKLLTNENYYQDYKFRSSIVSS